MDAGHFLRLAVRDAIRTAECGEAPTAQQLQRWRDSLATKKLGDVGKGLEDAAWAAYLADVESKKFPPPSSDVG